MQNSKAEYIRETLHAYKDDPKKFWRVLNDNLLKGNEYSSDITFNKGNEEYTGITESCDFLNSFFADIGRRLYSQFNNDLLQETHTNICNMENLDSGTS